MSDREKEREEKEHKECRPMQVPGVKEMDLEEVEISCKSRPACPYF